MKKIIGVALYVLFLLLVTICLLEYAVRELGLVNRLHNRCANIYYPRIGYLHKAHIRTDFFIEKRRIPYATNNLGFRDRDRDIAKSPHGTRFLVLGDSFVESPYTRLEETFPAILEKQIPGAEFINMGRMALGTIAELEILREFGLKMNPDRIIVAFYINDLVNNYFPPDQSYMPVQDPYIFHLKPTTDGYEPVFAKQYERRSAWRTFINEHFYLYQFLGDTIHNLNFGAKPDRGQAAVRRSLEAMLFDQPEAREVRVAWDLTEYALQEIRNYGIPILLVYIPARYELENSKEYNVVEKRLQSLCERLGIGFLNARDHGIETDDYLETDRHLNASGQELVAQAIAQYLNSSSPLSDPETIDK